MPKLTINGKEIEVPAGTNLIEAAKLAGVEVPHYCYHPGLSIAGQCRLCMVDIDKVPLPQIGCNTLAADGMVVQTETDLYGGTLAIPVSGDSYSDSWNVQNEDGSSDRGWLNTSFYSGYVTGYVTP